MVVLLLLVVFADLFFLALVFFDVYLWKEWFESRNTTADDYALRCFLGAVAILIYLFFGKLFWRRLLSTRRPGEDNPEFLEQPIHDFLQRPDGSKINIVYSGKKDGQPLIFIHGWNSNIHGWYYQEKYFREHYHLIMIDLAGLGKSTRPNNNDFSLAKMAQDLNAVIKYTGAKNPVLWGHSIGGMVILNLLAKHRQALDSPVKAIILEHTTYTNPLKTIMAAPLLTALQKPVLEPACWLMIVLSPLIWLIRWLGYFNGHLHILNRLLVFAGTQSPKQLDFITRLYTMAPPAVTARGVLGMFRYDVTKELPGIDIPAFVITADKDRLTIPEAGEYISNHLPNAKMFIVRPGGHMALVERHQEVNAAVEEFLRANG